ncbi:hypothetical protein CERZMDRAFT_102004 [Cercospora zeae-maydis SCOH1-5]|uniref:BTB domain-containing protein n=1 Tax=Cercospora zeae-maydis SCOH1-5 TaxID=717836 RepID=A0A6A6F5Z8_9PEZI|nr:hypothetical protein CERZMDRAFT_102004 [Cercospora zeae-maydis SCOH1-5]
MAGPPRSGPPSTLRHYASGSNSFQTLFKVEDYSDVTIKLSDREIPCHKAVICTQSEYFQKLCGKDSPFAKGNEKVVQLKEHDPDAVEAIIRYLTSYLASAVKSSAIRECLNLLHVSRMHDTCDIIIEIKSEYSDMEDLVNGPSLRSMSASVHCCKSRAL